MAQSLMCWNSGGKVSVSGPQGEHLPMDSIGPKGVITSSGSGKGRQCAKIPLYLGCSQGHFQIPQTCISTPGSSIPFTAQVLGSLLLLHCIFSSTQASWDNPWSCKIPYGTLPGTLPLLCPIINSVLAPELLNLFLRMARRHLQSHVE